MHRRKEASHAPAAAAVVAAPSRARGTRTPAGGASRRDYAPRPAQHIRLPVLSGWTSHFRAGEGGERRECANYDRCLDAFLGNGPAYCPADCARWEDPGRGAPATAFVSLNGAARGLPDAGRGR